MRHPLHELTVDTHLVRALLRDQHPDLADRPLVVTAAGWDNVTVRLGADLAVRLPVRAQAARLVEHEQRWLPRLAPSLPVPVPVPVRTGRPGGGYPWRWSIVPWFVGTPADAVPPAARDTWAEQLAAVLGALHRPAPDDAPLNPYRGVPLAARDGAVIARIATSPDAAVLGPAWRDGLAAPRWDGPSVWLHGDPHPGNLLTGDGRLAAVLDFGDVTAGDPASDLATAWFCFGPAGRDRFWAAYAAASGSDEDHLAPLRRRARAWAAGLVPALRAHPAEHAGLDAVGAHATAQLAAET